QLERDPLYAKDFARLLGMWRTRDQLKKDAEKFESVRDEFVTCKGRERRQASLRKSGQRLMPETREKIKELADALGSPESRYSQQLIAKALRNAEIGRKTADEIQERNERSKTLWQELQRTLPPAHRDFIAAAAK